MPCISKYPAHDSSWQYQSQNHAYDESLLHTSKPVVWVCLAYVVMRQFTRYQAEWHNKHWHCNRLAAGMMQQILKVWQHIEAVTHAVFKLFNWLSSLTPRQPAATMHTPTTWDQLWLDAQHSWSASNSAAAAQATVQYRCSTFSNGNCKICLMCKIVRHMHQLRCEWCHRYSHVQVSSECSNLPWVRCFQLATDSCHRAQPQHQRSLCWWRWLSSSSRKTQAHCAAEQDASSPNSRLLQCGLSKPPTC